MHPHGNATGTNLVEVVSNSIIGDSLSPLILHGVRVDHLISEGAKGHVGSLRNVEELATMRLRQTTSKQWPELGE